MDDNYPRDLVGYGQKPPHADWPGGARIAVQFVLNYEEGGENCTLHGDPASEAFLSEIVGAQPLEGRAAHEHGVDLRIRQPRRGVAGAAPVRRAQHAAHLLWRRHGDRPAPGGGAGDDHGRP